jgi:kynureninase
MATTYIVLEEGGSGETASYTVAGRVEDAANAEQARRQIAEGMNESRLNNDGVTLIAVPERNWRTGRGTLKAETTRRIRSA